MFLALLWRNKRNPYDFWRVALLGVVENSGFSGQVLDDSAGCRLQVSSTLSHHHIATEMMLHLNANASPLQGIVWKPPLLHAATKQFIGKKNKQKKPFPVSNVLLAHHPLQLINFSLPLPCPPLPPVLKQTVPSGKWPICTLLSTAFNLFICPAFSFLCSPNSYDGAISSAADSIIIKLSDN